MLGKNFAVSQPIATASFTLLVVVSMFALERDGSVVPSAFQQALFAALEKRGYGFSKDGNTFITVLGESFRVS